jgi:hypothetical protein
MRLAIFAAALAMTTMPAAPAFAQAAPAASACSRLQTEWRGYELELARNYASGVIDDSVPRATMRAAEDTATYTRAAITLRLMEANKCTLPTGSPSPMTYALEALQCRNAQTGASIDAIRAGIPQCKSEDWKGS